MTDFDIAIAGAGIVGTSTALWAQMRGHHVLLIDPNAPGSGASSGNACTLATYACLPVNDPSVLASLPRLMFGSNSPLSISYLHAMSHPRWMLSFLANCRAKRSRAIAGSLADLLAHADEGLNPLVAEAGAEDLLVARGQLSIWSTKDGARGAAAGLDLRRAFGVPFEELSPAEANAMEPELALPIERAVFYPKARHVRDPEELVRRLHARFAALGGTTLCGRVSSVQADDDGVDVTVDGSPTRVRRAVIASGAYSRQIVGSGAERLPLGTERGYNLLFDGEAHRLSRPVGWAEGGFYAVPMAKGLRLAGTVEISSLGARANSRRLSYLARRGSELLSHLPEPSSSWLGFRPTMPDSLPVIGLSPTSDRIIHAFGHQHLGLTLGGITGRIVVDLAEGRRPEFPIDRFRGNRRYALAR